MSPRPIALTGVKCSADHMHIGNWVGAVQPLMQLRETHEVFAFIADLHALTSVHSAAAMRDHVFSQACQWLAMGADDARVTFFPQSLVPQHAELNWYLATSTPYGLLSRAHAFKDAQAKGNEVNAGVFTYPVLMAADILLYQADVVPTGKDQKQHVEIARDAAERFMTQYAADGLFKLPEPMIDEDTGVLPGTDGRKMSKSYGNTIPIFADEKTIEKSIMGMPTGSTPLGESIAEGGATLLKIHGLLLDDAGKTALLARYHSGQIGYGHAKKELFAAFMDFYGPARAKYAAYAADRGEVERILRAGAAKAAARAEETMAAVRAAAGTLPHGK